MAVATVRTRELTPTEYNDLEVSIRHADTIYNNLRRIATGIGVVCVSAGIVEFITNKPDVRSAVLGPIFGASLSGLAAASAVIAKRRNRADALLGASLEAAERAPTIEAALAREDTIKNPYRGLGHSDFPRGRLFGGALDSVGRPAIPGFPDAATPANLVGSAPAELTTSAEPIPTKLPIPAQLVTVQ